MQITHKFKKMKHTFKKKNKFYKQKKWQIATLAPAQCTCAISIRISTLMEVAPVHSRTLKSFS